MDSVYFKWYYTRVSVICLGPEPFILGGRDLPEEDYNITTLWQKDLACNSTVNITAYEIAILYLGLETLEEGNLFITRSNDIIIGLGVFGGEDRNPLIDGKNSIRICFAEVKLSHLTVGVRNFEFLAELGMATGGQWIAYLDGREVARGTFSGEDFIDNKLEFDIDVTGEFNSIHFTTGNIGNYALEFIEGEVPCFNCM